MRRRIGGGSRCRRQEHGARAAALPALRCRMVLTSISTAICDISNTGCRIVVNSNQMLVASAVSSQPQTVRSPGMSSPRRSEIETAAAMLSAAAKIAVGGTAKSCSTAAAARPERLMDSPGATRSGVAVSTLAASAAR